MLHGKTHKVQPPRIVGEHDSGLGSQSECDVVPPRIDGEVSQKQPDIGVEQRGIDLRATVSRRRGPHPRVDVSYDSSACANIGDAFNAERSAVRDAASLVLLQQRIQVRIDVLRRIVIVGRRHLAVRTVCQRRIERQRA